MQITLETYPKRADHKEMLVRGVENVEYRGERNYNSRIQPADLMMPELSRKLYSH
jgi:hypothetical protein